MPTFLRGYRHFGEQCQRIGFVRFEDLTRDPDRCLRLLCSRLNLAYDADYKYKWQQYTTITGDKPGASRAGMEIRPIPRKPVTDFLLKEFEENSDYREEAISLLGYSQSHENSRNP